MHRAVSSHRPLVFAHRGGSKLAPENSIPAFDRGLAEGADGLELDVHLSRDGVVMVHHDAWLDRTTDASGPLASRTAAELALVDVTGGRGPAGQTGIPTLPQVLERYTDAPLIVELKTAGRALVRATVDAVRRAGATDRVCIGSFSWRALHAARGYEPAIPTGAARLEVRAALCRARLNQADWRPPYQVFHVPEASGATPIVTPEFVEFAHRAGVAVQVWTVDEPEDIHRLIEWGVDAIITDRPDVAVPIVRQSGASRAPASDREPRG